MQPTTITRRLEALRELMRQSGVAACVIPHVDPHQSEYMARHWHVREHFSGFNGSAGTLVVALDRAALWTDSRYFLQAADQLRDAPIELMREGMPGTPAMADYIINVLRAGERVGLDGMLFTKRGLDALEATLAKAGIAVDAGFRPAERLWAGRPPLPPDPVYLLPEAYAGEAAAAKLARLRRAVAGAGADAIFITALDAIAWLLNLRGTDVDYNPVFYATLYVGPEGGALFIDPAKVPAEVAAYLAGCRIEVRPYGDAAAFLAACGRRVLADPDALPAAMARTEDVGWLFAPSPVAAMKAVRSEVELRNLRHAMVLDGAALARAVVEVLARLAQGEPVGELDVASAISRHRAADPSYRGESFATIAAYADHGAIVHYEPTPATNAMLRPEGLLLIDTGAQYLYGTTDITRTIALGAPTADERHDFTLVLKGHIALARAVFPEGTRGAQLDALARQYLWQEGKNYLHGTGHGVGHFLNVHEGPQSIRLQENPVALRPGMVTSNEPGLYLAGRYGIRCENLVLTTEAMTTDCGRFLRFATLSLFPFDRTLLDPALLAPDEVEWLNAYHSRVASLLAPRLQGPALDWLLQACAPLP